MMTDYFQFQHV